MELLLEQIRPRLSLPDNHFHNTLPATPRSCSSYTASYTLRSLISIRQHLYSFFLFFSIGRRVVLDKNYICFSSSFSIFLFFFRQAKLTCCGSICARQPIIRTSTSLSLQSLLSTCTFSSSRCVTIIVTDINGTMTTTSSML